MSKTQLPIPGGIVPEKLLALISNLRILFNLPISGGISPVNLFPLSRRICKFGKFEIEAGRVPENRLFDRFNCASLEDVLLVLHQS